MAAYPPLVPLRIPSNWSVMFNIFVEYEDLGSLSDADVSAYLSEDIFWIAETRGQQLYREGWSLDLGWYPAGSRDGEYRLACMREGGWDDTADYSSRDWRQVRDAADLALSQRYWTVPALAEAFAALPSSRR